MVGKGLTNGGQGSSRRPSPAATRSWKERCEPCPGKLKTGHHYLDSNSQEEGIVPHRIGFWITGYMYRNRTDKTDSCNIDQKRMHSISLINMIE